MKTLTLFILIAAFAASADAGILKVATYPVRHPVKTVKHSGLKQIAHAAWKVVY